MIAFRSLRTTYRYNLVGAIFFVAMFKKQLILL